MTVPEVSGAFVDHIPAVDFVTVAYSDLHDPFGDKDIYRSGEFRNGFSDLFGSHIFERSSDTPCFESSVGGVAFQIGFEEIVKGDLIYEPVGDLPGVVVPDKGMSVEPDTFGKTELHHRICGRAPPVGLFPWLGAVVPELRRVPVFSTESGASFLQFQLFPVEGDGGRVEKRSVKFFVAAVSLVGPQLIVVEDVGTENKIVRDLFSLDRSACGRWRQLKDAVSFSVFFNIGVDPGLFLFVPQPAVCRGDDSVDLCLRKIGFGVLGHCWLLLFKS